MTKHVRGYRVNMQYEDAVCAIIFMWRNAKIFLHVAFGKTNNLDRETEVTLLYFLFRFQISINTAHTHFMHITSLYSFSIRSTLCSFCTLLCSKFSTLNSNFLIFSSSSASSSETQNSTECLTYII